MDKKVLIDKLLLDLADDAPMSKLMLKAQAVSFELKNQKFSIWVRNEQRGYKDGESIPKYREVECILKVDIFIPFQGIVTNFTIPVDLIKDKTIRQFLSSTKLALSLSELEDISKKK